MKDPRKCLPELFDLVDSLAAQIDDGELKDWDSFAPQVREFFTSRQLDKVEEFVKGWKHMASYANGITLIHVTSALVGLVQLPEYKSASRAGQRIMEWIILFHDIGKQILPEGGRDAVHAFRSAALTAPSLRAFELGRVDDLKLEAWCDETRSAVKLDETSGEMVQDNGCLPSILDGLERLFGHNTPETLIIKSVLLHMAVNVVAEWPQPAPVDSQSIPKSIDKELFPYLKVMMLVDSEAWSMFDLDTKMKYRQETLAVFERISALIDNLTIL
jgi:hypothetical protein